MYKGATMVATLSHFNVAAFLFGGLVGASGGCVELVPDPCAEALRVRGADPCAFLFGPTEKLNLGCHVFGVGISGGVALAGVAVWCGFVCHFFSRGWLLGLKFRAHPPCGILARG